MFYPTWDDSPTRNRAWHLSLLSSSRCPAPPRFSVLAKRIQHVGYSPGHLLPSGIWDSGHRALGPALQTLLRPPRWAVTQPRVAWVVFEDHAMLTSKNSVQPPNPHSDIQILPREVTSHLSPSWDPKCPGYQNLKIKRGTEKPKEHDQRERQGLMSEFDRLGKCEEGGNAMEGTTPNTWNSCKAQTSLTGLRETGDNSFQHTHKPQHTRATG